MYNDDRLYAVGGGAEATKLAARLVVGVIVILAAASFALGFGLGVALAVLLR